MCIRDRFQAECESKGRNEGIELGIETEKVNSIISMLEFGITKEQILTKYTKEDLERAEAVSYTHLDVYKRQEFCWSEHCFKFFCGFTA